MNPRLRWFFTICVMAGASFLSLSGCAVEGQLRARANAPINDPLPLEDAGSGSLSNLAQAYTPSVWAFGIKPPVTSEKITLLARSEVFFLSPSHAWVISFQDHLDPIVWRTQDGGNTWEMSHLYPEPEAPGAPPHEKAWIGFTDPDHGWLALEYNLGMVNPRAVVLYLTDDGGTTWEHRSNLPCPAMAFNFFDAQHGWMVCYGDLMPWLLQTADGGQNWSSIELPLPENEDVFACSGDSPTLFSPTSGALLLYCWSKAGSGSTLDLLYYKQDSEQTWRSSGLPGDSSQLVAPHYDVQFLDPQSAILFGPDGYPAVEPFERQIHRTLDGGQTWEKMGSLPWSAQINFVDIDHGWALRESGGRHTLLYTADGGRTWNAISLEVIP